MQRIGIMTFPKSPSFGASLQMYALYKAIQELGFEVEVINYVNQYMKEKRHFSAPASGAKKIISWLLDYPNRAMFSRFEQQISMYPSKPIHSSEALKTLPERYEYMICGSDQVWNPYITGNDMGYLFDFCQEGRKKVSYAPSFGVENLGKSEASRYAVLLRDFASISVREEKGKELVKKLIGEEPKIVVDPTMLIPSKQWRNEEKKKKGIPDQYIACFIFNQRDYITEYAKNLSREKHCPLLLVGGNEFTKLKRKNYSGSLGPREWLYVIDHADAVITDSFHGAVFSLIFGKELHASMESPTKSRLETLLRTFDAECCIIPSGVTDSRQYQHVDQRSTYQILREKRNESIDYLRTALHVAK